MAPHNTKFSLEFLATLDRDEIVERLLLPNELRT